MDVLTAFEVPAASSRLAGRFERADILLDELGQILLTCIASKTLSLPGVGKPAFDFARPNIGVSQSVKEPSVVFYKYVDLTLLLPFRNFPERQKLYPNHSWRDRVRWQGLAAFSEFACRGQALSQFYPGRNIVRMKPQRLSERRSALTILTNRSVNDTQVVRPWGSRAAARAPAYRAGN